MKIKILATDVVAGSVFLAGEELDLADALAQSCIDAGIAVRILPVSVETETVPVEAVVESIPAKPGKRNKGD